MLIQYGEDNSHSAVIHIAVQMRWQRSEINDVACSFSYIFALWVFLDSPLIFWMLLWHSNIWEVCSYPLLAGSSVIWNTASAMLSVKNSSSFLLSFSLGLYELSVENNLASLSGFSPHFLQETFFWELLSRDFRLIKISFQIFFLLKHSD